MWGTLTPVQIPVPSSCIVVKVYVKERTTSTSRLLTIYVTIEFRNPFLHSILPSPFLL